jgi:Fe-S-cluster containining protein
MDKWQKLLNIKRPEFACTGTGTCCQAATSIQPWNKIHKASYDQTLRDFFNIFIPYEDHTYVQKQYPEAYNACLEILKTRDNITINDLYFYRCRFIKPPNFCTIYEDRPTLCRNFPESPFDSIPSTCGYYSWAQECKKKYFTLQRELRKLKCRQYSEYKFYMLSPAKSWLF